MTLRALMKDSDPVAATSKPTGGDAATVVGALIARARAAQRIADDYDQARTDELVTAAGWAIVNPDHNKRLAEIAVRDSGLGNVADKIAKNRRKTIGLLADLRGAKSVGIIAQSPDLGLTEIARPVGVVGAITPSTNPGATPANNIINALKGRNAIILAPSPKGHSTGALLIEYIHAELERIGAPRDLVQQLPAPITREATIELMRQVDLVIATGSQSNVRGAYASGTPAIGVGAGNVVVVIDETADVEDAAAKIAASKMFDNATSCSSENAIVVVDAIRDRVLAALAAAGGVMLDATEKAQLGGRMFAGGKLSPTFTAQAAPAIAALAGFKRDAPMRAGFLMVEEDGVGSDHPFSGEKLSPVLAVYRAPDFAGAMALTERILRNQGAGHSVGLHSARDDRAVQLGLRLPVCRVIVNQAHCFATGGSFDNALPFSLSMGCGTWGRNSISDNLNYRHFLNITRVARPMSTPREEPSEQDLFGTYRQKYGA
jgi:sulfoacetaldehyde dehydrogenase